MKLSDWNRSVIRRHPAFKVAIVLLLSALLLGMPGCGGDATPTPTVTTTPTSIVTTTAAPPTTPAATTVLPRPGGELPIVEEPVTLRILVAQSLRIMKYPGGENAFTAWLEERTGVQVELILFPSLESTKSSIDPRMYSDICDLWLCRCSRQYAEEWALRGNGLYPLDDLLETYGPHIRAALDRSANGRTMAASLDGQIYALPALPDPDILDPDAIGMRMWIHSGFLEKYGQGMPTTTEELFAFLTWVRDADANGNGDPDDEIGWTGSAYSQIPYARPTDFLMNAFTLQNGEGYYVQDGVIHYAVTEDSYRNGLRFLRRLMAEGLMDPDYADHSSTETHLAAVEQGDGDTVACVSAMRRTDFSDDPAIRDRYIAVPPLTGPHGLRYALYDPYAPLQVPYASSSNAAERSQMVGTSVAMIPKNSRMPEVAMAFLDALYDPEVLDRARFGEYGVDWTLAADGNLAADGGPARVEILRDVWSGETMQHWGESLSLLPRPGPGWLTATSGEANREVAVEYAAARMYESAVIPCAIPPLRIDPETAYEILEARAIIYDYTRSIVTDFIYGQLDINDDAVWADTIATLQGMGLDKCLKAMQTAFDRDWRDVYAAAFTPVPQRTE
jgi:putative aldouronate transport system substrate-binding protein